MDEIVKGQVKSVISAMLDKKAMNVISMEVGEVTPLADCFILASGNSSVHMNSLVNAATQALDEQHINYKIEGNAGTQWTLIDAGSIVIHVFSVKGREYYKLERIWGDVPIKRYDSENDG